MAILSQIACPVCGHPESDVTDSRGVIDARYIRRRRKCQNGHRYRTYEVASAESTECPPEEAIYGIGDRLRKEGGDYSFEGEVVMVGRKRSGAIRYVLEDDRGLLFIFNEAQLAFAQIDEAEAGLSLLAEED